METLAVVGAGSWGTALAIALAPKTTRLHLWVREHEIAETINRKRRNMAYLPDFPIPSNVEAFTGYEDCLHGAEMVVLAPPSHAMRRLVLYALPWLRADAILVSATKGLEENTHARMSEVITEVTSTAFQPRLAVLSGPSFAKEVAAGEPAALVVASRDADVARTVQEALSGNPLRLYTNDDPVGVELGASLKNVIAIAAGVCAGLGLGSNPRAALVSRGLAEITRLAVAMGGKPQTLAGLAGLGDLVLTCMGDLSRNRNLGIQLAKGLALGEILNGMTMVAEGVNTTFAALELAQSVGVEMPITAQMALVLKGQRTPEAALRELMERMPRPE
ncbi:MAG: NAD(P)-dependent glycerol-3-phosphate dehydrogenase [Bryobacterales bacterium]|jgi:glycerol-3-phosphate dehydrogenase (NAD(P)+)|nr:NAD(P)-dependent glycerol-3-phosphate dehydrogenase [Bryobacterales bacterium]